MLHVLKFPFIFFLLYVSHVRIHIPAFLLVDLGSNDLILMEKKEWWIGGYFKKIFYWREIFFQNIHLSSIPHFDGKKEWWIGGYFKKIFYWREIFFSEYSSVVYSTLINQLIFFTTEVGLFT